MFTKRMSSLKLDAVEVRGSTRLNSWHISLALHVLIVFAIFHPTFNPPIAEMPDNKATIELVFVTAKPYYRVMNDLLTIKKDKILGSSQQLANNERSLNPELLDKNNGSSVPKFLSTPPDLQLIEKQIQIVSKQKIEQNQILIIEQREAGTKKRIVHQNEMNPVINSDIIAKSPQNRGTRTKNSPENLSSPTFYKGDILGASVRLGGSKLQSNKSDSPSQPLVACSYRGRTKVEKNIKKQPDENKKTTITALLGGNFAYHAIRQQQHLNITALLGGGLGQKKSPRVEDLLNVRIKASNEPNCSDE